MDAKSQKIVQDIKALIDSRVKQAAWEEGGEGQATFMMPELRKQESEVHRENWTKERKLEEIVKEYRKAYSMICLQPKWIQFTKAIDVLHSLGSFEDREDIKKKLADKDFFSKTAIKLVQKAYGLKGADFTAVKKLAEVQICIISGQNLYLTLQKLFDALRWRKPYLTLALHYWLHLGSPDSLIARLSETVTRAARCLSVKRIAFDLVVRHADFLIKQTRAKGKNVSSGKGGDSKEEQMTLEEAKSRCHTIFEEYVDMHKIMAYDTGIREPISVHYMSSGRKDYVQYHNNHGINWFLASVMSTISLQLPMIPYLSDPAQGGHSGFWHAKGMDKVWEVYAKPENFGRKWQKIPELKKFVKNKTCPKYASDDMFFGQSFNVRPKEFAAKLASTKSDPKTRSMWALYMERLCHFFEMEFFCTKAISVLMQENSDFAEMLGFRTAMGVVFQAYRKHEGKEAVPEETLVDFVYDEGGQKYDFKRVNNLFHYCGLTNQKVSVDPRKTEEKKIDKKEEPEVKLEAFKGSLELLKVVEEKVNAGESLGVIIGWAKKGEDYTSKEVFDAHRYVMKKKAMVAS